jgi:lipoyl(octanoyl) transferase
VIPVQRCRLIVDPPAPGSWNMSVDEALLEAAVAGDATLRFYQWIEPTLSLGYFQRYGDRAAHAASQACPVVRRQSGGGAILHDRELTYSLSLPPAFPLARDPGALYTTVHNAFRTLLARDFTPARAAPWQLEINRRSSPLAPSEEPFLCFQRRACGDLLLESPPAAATNSPPLAYKILGSAQRRHRGAILQHGSLLIARSPRAPELPGWEDLTGGILPLGELTASLVRQLSGLLPVDSRTTELSVATFKRAREIEQVRYSSRSWTARR